MEGYSGTDILQMNVIYKDGTVIPFYFKMDDEMFQMLDEKLLIQDNYGYGQYSSKNVAYMVVDGVTVEDPADIDYFCKTLSYMDYRNGERTFTVSIVMKDGYSAGDSLNGQSDNVYLSAGMRKRLAALRKGE